MGDDRCRNYGGPQGRYGGDLDPVRLRLRQGIRDQIRGGQRTRYSVVGKPGLQLVVSPGDLEPTRRWYVRYQVGRGRDERRRGNDAIGDIKHWSIAQAWEKATQIIRQAQSGADPKGERDEAAAKKVIEARTVAVVYREWLDDPRRKRVLRGRTREEYERIFKSHIAPRLGATPISSLNEPTIYEALEEVRAATTDKKKG